MKKKILISLTLLPFLYSCQFSDNKKKQENAIKINSVSVVIDDKLWNGEIGDSIRNKFATPVIGLPQEEPLFTINQYPNRHLDGTLTNCRNIIVIKKENKSKFEIRENQYTYPQNIIEISGQSVSEIIDSIEHNTFRIIQKIRQTEIIEIQKNNLKTPFTTKKVTKKFGISLHFPKGYRYVMQKKKFLWLKKEINSGSTSIIIYQVPLYTITKHNNYVNNIVRMRDSIGNLFIHGAIRGTKMITENSYAPYFTKTTLGGNECFETKGSWQMRNDFMSGPFVNYCTIDKPKNRYIVIEGFCYAPSKEKRDLMLEMEAIIKSLEIIRKPNKKK